MTRTQSIINALLALGATEVRSNSSKCRTFTRAGVPCAYRSTALYYFVGRAASLRFGDIYTKSYPVADHIVERLITTGKFLRA